MPIMIRFSILIRAGHAATSSSLQSKIKQNEAAMERQEHLYLAQKKASTPAPAKPASPAPAKPAQTTKPAATVSAKQAPAKAVTAAPVTPKPAAKTSAPATSATSVAQSKTAATMANLTKQNQLLAAELKIAKKNEQAPRQPKPQ
ncbi:hypothetical protein [Paenibacillus sp. MMS20-IR301]|uniref:hypothetical protein n=1 Tax=Paenibacillus sp. MMS20-IR301 TaxID=2895946 RepID=UPI0028E1D593|nr:hypothetical protein [Paenibacillus sp. MMS20-IR301]WNS43274.1 hypothetical protein LOS79_30775 [Paenibacillus sp. MMS20-IR301]